MKDKHNADRAVSTAEKEKQGKTPAEVGELSEKLYLVLIGTPGIFATIIRAVTRIKYIHIVLGMDEDLKDCYSFGRRNPKVPILSGFEKEEMEEDRLLSYVAITRAKQTLTISHAKQRMLYGRTNAALPSRFLNEIPEEMVIKKGGYHPRTYESSHANNYGTYQGGYYQKPAPQKRTELGSVATAKVTYLELNKGDMVEHTAFGKGMVLSVMKMGGDALLEIAFDQIGTKKLMAKTASAHMKRLS